MPPKPKFTKDEIVAAALDIVSSGGVDALTARELGRALGSSSRPIFTVFDGMEQLLCSVKDAAMQRYDSFFDMTSDDLPSFKRRGMQMLMFAVKEPNLYKLLFMQQNESARSFHDIFVKLGVGAGESIQTLLAEYALTSGEASRLFQDMWIYTYGVGTLCATGACSFGADELGRMLTEQFNALLLYIRSNRGADQNGGQ